MISYLCILLNLTKTDLCIILFFPFLRGTCGSGSEKYCFSNYQHYRSGTKKKSYFFLQWLTQLKGLGVFLGFSVCHHLCRPFPLDPFLNKVGLSFSSQLVLHHSNKTCFFKLRPAQCTCLCVNTCEFLAHFRSNLKVGQVSCFI